MYDYIQSDFMYRRDALKSIGGITGVSLIAGCIGGDEGEYPSQEMTAIVPYSSGGGFDQYTRILASHLPDHLPNSVEVRVQNVTGSGGIVATEQVYNSEPDGYTFMIQHIPSSILDQVIQEPDYDLQEMTWLPQIADDPSCITVGANTEIHTWDDFVTAIENEEVNIGVTSVQDASTIAMAAIGHIGGEFNARKIFENLVIYDGSAEIIQGIIRGDVQVRAGSFESLMEYVESDDLRMIMVATMDEQVPERVSNPDAETLQSANIEQGEGIEGLSGVSRVFHAPPDLPEDRTEILRESITSALQSEDLIADAEEAGRNIVYTDSQTVEERVLGAFENIDLYQEILDIANEVEDQY